MSRKLLEVIAYHAADCRIAQEAGADRIELCANPAEGGTTPSAGTILLARRLSTLPIFCMIRPRGGNFIYTDIELRIMLADIAFARAEGCDGLVLGVLNSQAEIDEAALDRLLYAAGDLPVTFHRAYDRLRDPEAGLEFLIHKGIQRVLTSGAATTAHEGTIALQRLVQQADGRIVIMPGGGVRHSNLRQLSELTGAQEFHTSASMRINGESLYAPPGLAEQRWHIGADAAEISKCRAVLDQLTTDGQE